MSDPTTLDHILALLVGLVLPLGGAVRGRGPTPTEVFDRSERIAFAYNGALSLTLMGLVVTAAAWFREGSLGRAAASLGLTEPPSLTPLAAWLTAGFLAVWALQIAARVATPARLERTRERWMRETPFMPRSAGELPHFAVLAVAAGVFEEIIFRGFLIPYLAVFVGSNSGFGVAAAIGVPAVIFGLCHLYQGLGTALLIAAMAVVVGIVFWSTGSLWIPVLLHTFIDLAAAYLGVRWIRVEAGSDGSPG